MKCYMEKKIVIPRNEQQATESSLRVETDREKERVIIRTTGGEWGDNEIWFPQQFTCDMRDALSRIAAFINEQEDASARESMAR